MMIRQSLQNIWAAFTASLLRLKALSKKELITLLSRSECPQNSLSVPILAQSILFGYGATFNLEEAPYVLYDASQTPDSRALSARLEANRIFKRAAEVPSAQAFTAAVADGRALVGFDPWKTLRKNFARGETAPVYVAADARNTTTANVAVGYAAAIIEEFNASRQVRSVLSLKTATATTKTASLAGISFDRTDFRPGDDSGDAPRRACSPRASVRKAL